MNFLKLQIFTVSNANGGVVIKMKKLFQSLPHMTKLKENVKIREIEKQA